jgi:hypothetical protein
MVELRSTKTSNISFEHFRSFNENKLECGALIGAMTEFVEGQYVNVDSEVWAKASCLGSTGPKGQKLACSGSAMVHHKFKEAKKQVCTCIHKNASSI